MAKRVEAVIVAKQKINHDCYIFSFEYLQEQIVFTIGQHFRIIKELPTLDYPEGEELSKKYTPINHSSQTVFSIAYSE
jgi:NAD(P)H-flavin reductase